MAEGSPDKVSPVARPVPSARPRRQVVARRPDRRVVALSAILAVLLVAVTVVWWSRRDTSEPLDAPSGFEVSLAEGLRPAATVSFDAVDGADAYLVRFDDEATGPILVEGMACQDGRCQLTFDRMTAGGARAVRITALGPDAESDASQEAALPDWPAVEEQGNPWPEEGPVPLVVTRQGAGGRPEYETELVEAGPDVGERVEARIAELEADEGVLNVDVDLPAQVNQTSGGGHIPEGLSTWQDLAWDYDSLPSDLDGSGVTVAVIDSAFDPDHPALQGADVGPITNVGDPGMTNETALEELGQDHGTAVVSMIVGQPGTGVTGIAPATTIPPYSTWTDDVLEFMVFGPRILSSAIADSIVHAVDAGAEVVTMSMSVPCFGTGPHRYCPERTLSPAVEYAESRGVVVVAATPNDGHETCDDAIELGGTNNDAWPAMFDTVVAVGGANPDGSRYECSPEREYVDIRAPAYRLQVAAMDGYPVWSGTSFATPLVAGLVALVLQAEPGMAPAEVRSLLAESSLDDGRVIPLEVMERLGRLDEGATTAGDSYLMTEAMVRDADWPYRGVSLPLDAAPEGGSAVAMLTDALGEPTATDPASWRGGGEGPDDPRPAPEEGGEPDMPECWSGLYGLAMWQEGDTPLLGVLYAREELPLASGQTVPAGALLGYRIFRDSALVRMADGIAIGRTQADLEAFYQRADQPSREVSFVDDSGEFELVGTGRANPTTPNPTGPTSDEAPGPDRGRMSGTTDPGRATILERGAGSQCALDAETVTALLGAGSGGGGGGGGGSGPGECARVGIVLDASPSIVDAGAEDQVRSAATGVVDALAETGAEVRISAFAGFPVSLTSGWMSLADDEGRRLARQVVGSMAFEGEGTNWEAALMDMAGQDADVVVFVTDGNPNEYGVGITGTPSPEGNTEFDPVALSAGVAAADVLRGQGARIVAVGAGDVRSDALAQVSDEQHVGDFSDLGPSLTEIAGDLCGG